MNRSTLGVLFTSCLVACVQSAKVRDPLAGEWRIRFDALSESIPRNSATFALGAIVFDRRIDNFGYEDSTLLPKGAVFGRAYLPMQADGRLMTASAGVPFKQGPDADLQEETVAVQSEQGGLVLSLAPKMSHFGLELNGAIAGDTARGTWKWKRGDTARPKADSSCGV